MKLKDIDFRLWDKKKAKFIDLNQQSIVFFNGDLQREGKFALVSPDFVCSPVLNADDFDIEPYSCIKDMCGNKLYENDIVAHMSGRVIEYHCILSI